MRWATTGGAKSVIRTVHGRGYRFVAPVTERAGGHRRAAAVHAVARRRAIASDRSATRWRTRCSTIARPATGPNRSGSPVVFVPGFVSNVELQWELPAMADTFRRLGRGRRLMLFDKRGTGGVRAGHGRSPPDASRSAWTTSALVMDAAGIERAALVGISEGGPLVAAAVAATYSRARRPPGPVRHVRHRPVRRPGAVRAGRPPAVGTRAGLQPAGSELGGRRGDGGVPRPL